MGVDWTDEFLMKVSELTGKPIPESLAKERGRLVDMMTDSHAWLHGKKLALYGDPDFVMGLVKILLRVRRRTDARRQQQRHQALAEGDGEDARRKPVRHQCQGVHRPRPLAPAQLCFTDKPDFLIGNSYGKFIQRDTLHKGKEFEVPLIRIGFPLFDRHHLHRQTTLGYEGAMQVVTTLVNAVLERLDEETMGMGTTDYNFDLVR
jgi:nitrogenase molybdenum-iron protein beta chain